MHLTLIRHGKTNWNSRGLLMGRKDIPLNDTGKQEAKKLNNYFRNFTDFSLFSSPLKRCLQTAEIATDTLYSIVEDFIEIDAGPWTGIPKDVLMQKYPDSWRKWRSGCSIFPNQETYHQVQKRVVKAIKNLISKEKTNHIMIVTHSGVIRSFLAYILNKQFEEIEKKYVVSSGGIVECSFDNKWKLDGIK